MTIIYLYCIFSYLFMYGVIFISDKEKKVLSDYIAFLLSPIMLPVVVGTSSYK